MPNFDSGVASYITGTCTVTVHFPVDRRGNAAITCIHCPYLSNNQRMCWLNREVVDYPEKFVGRECPLKVIE